ncbi:MAG: bifunctional [glutamate--ammonia ligase]-adenylyl-L-tyrosine phosphorylase/[glutamate--ammonia-ligase] adenylyltransferase [Thermodesulfobacteriota bacterium]
MDFSFEDYCASPLRDEKKLEKVSELKPAFIEYLEELEKEVSEKNLINELKISGYYSEFFQESLLKIKGFFSDSLILSDLVAPYKYSSYDYIKNKNVDSEEELKLFLYKSVKKEMSRIAFRDITGRSSCAVTLKDLSFLADAAVSKALDFLHDDLAKIYGEPVDKNGQKQKLMAVAMGKLGAFELNFSSDIDLMFVFPEKGETDKEKSISSEEFFIKVARKFVSVFKGPVPGDNTYIVDLRLRPFGESGPLVMSINAVEHYYKTQGREWERYALIKSRCITGFQKDIENFYESMEGFVFRRYLDYGAFDSMRDMKKKILYEIKKKGNKNNIKNGSGGIREIEFFGQIFQLIRGGIDKRFREKSIVSILRLLGEEQMIPLDVSLGLEKSYVFLRICENRIQQLKGEQTHLLPENKQDRAKISMSLGFSSFESFYEFLSSKREYVHSHFMAVLRDESAEQEDSDDFYMKMYWDSPEKNETEFLEGLDGNNISYDKDILRIIKNFKNEIAQIRVLPETLKRLDKLMPLLIKELLCSKAGPEAANRVVGLVMATIKKSCYLSLLIENPGAVHHLVRLCIESSWVGNYLKSHPVLLDELLDPRTLYYPPEKDEMSVVLDSRISGISFDDTERFLETLCVFKQSMTLRIASAEISGEYPLMKISDRLTELAEVITERVLQKAWVELVDRFGYPVDKSGEKLLNPGVAVIAYGKLGGIELGYGSDLDLVFVHDDVEGVTTGEKSVSCVQFYSKLARKVLSYLSSHTSAGKMYEIDLRLRPGGSSGVIIVSLFAFAEYFLSKAWIFECQAFVKARIIFGHENLEKSFSGIRKEILSKKRDKEFLKENITEMRDKIIKTHGSGPGDFFHIKHDQGAMMDIEFLVQYLVLKNCHKNQKLLLFTDIVRILSTLEKEGFLSRKEASFLRLAYLVFRSMGHKLDLVEKKPMLESARFLRLRTGVRLIWNKHLG